MEWTQCESVCAQSAVVTPDPFTLKKTAFSSARTHVDGYLPIMPQCAGALAASRISEGKRTHPAQLSGFVLLLTGFVLLLTVAALCKNDDTSVTTSLKPPTCSSRFSLLGFRATAPQGIALTERTAFFCLISKIQTERELRKRC